MRSGTLVLTIIVTIGISIGKIQAQEKTPENHTIYSEVNINQISPGGWLENWLQIQTDGITGYIDSVGYPFNTGMWKSEIEVKPEGNPSWWPYEQTAYWIDGGLRCGYLTNNEELINKAGEQIEYVFNNASKEGVLGPKHYSDSKWPHVVFFRGVMAYYMATKDKSVLDAMIKHYKATEDDYSEFFRNNMNIEIMWWLYEQTGDQSMKDLAIRTHKEADRHIGQIPLERMMSDTIPRGHGVTVSENIKIPLFLYFLTGEQRYLDAAINQYEKMEKHHVLIDGVPSSVESLEGNSLSNMAHETCDIVDYSWSLGYMLMATGDAKWADKIERAFLNAGFGASTKEFKSHQYHSAPNQMIADYRSNTWDVVADWFSNKTKRKFAYRAGHTPECCTGNITRLAPNYISRMWMKTKDNGIAATLYGPSKIKFMVGNENKEVAIKQTTDYPFSEEILFEFEMKEKTSFPFQFRVPSWCKNAKAYVNGKLQKIDLKPGTFVTLNRSFKSGDKIKLELPMELNLLVLPYDGVAIERGPLVYSLPIEEKRERVKDERYSTVLNTWEMTPEGRWQYALNLDKDSFVDKVEIIKSPMPENPWELETTPIKLKVPAYEHEEWDLHIHRVTPNLPSRLVIGEKTEITLTPLGSTLLRVSIFPDMKRQFSMKVLDELNAKE